jgi:hypothetical protein
MLSWTSVLEVCLSIATMISAISEQNSGEAIKRLLAVIVEHAEETSWVSKALNRSTVYPLRLV